MMRTLAIFLVIVAAGTVCMASTSFYVDSGAECPGAGTVESPFCAIDSCNAAMLPGDRCMVSAGTHTGFLKPSRSGEAGARVTYDCPSRQCVIQASAVNVVDLYNKSYVTVDGFRFEGAGSRLRLSGYYSVGNHVLNVTGGTNVGFKTSGGTETVLENFEFHGTSSLMNLGNVASSGNGEFGTRLKSGLMRGGDTTLRIGACTDCVIDDVTVAGASEFGIEIDGAERLTVKNSTMLPSGLYGHVGPFVKDVQGLDFLNNSISRGWYLPSPGYPCGLTGTIRIRNNIFVNAGRGMNNPMAQLAVSGSCGMVDDWPPTLEIDYNAYVGADNFVDDPYTFGDDTVPVAVDASDVLSVVSYFRHGTPDPTDWAADTGHDANSLVFEDLEYGSGSAPTSDDGPLWGRSAPFWGAIVTCPGGTSSFETNSSWAEGLKVGDRLECEFDGVARQITAITSGSGGAADGCQKTIQFSPALDQATITGQWFLSYARSGPELVGKEWFPVEGSPVIDAGDSEFCGHEIRGAGCDIGPREFVPGQLVGAIVSGQADKNKLKWTRIVDATEYAVYRGDLGDLANGGYGDCVTPLDSNPSDTTYQDAQVPPPGQGFFYILESANGTAADGLGSSSFGTPRDPELRCN